MILYVRNRLPSQASVPKFSCFLASTGSAVYRTFGFFFLGKITFAVSLSLLRNILITTLELSLGIYMTSKIYFDATRVINV
jgi:hypothetical protein